MTTSVITQHTSKITVTDVEDVQVTEVVEDNGEYVRAIRIFGAPEGVNAAPVIELLVRSTDQNKIKVTTPEIDF
jgi:hypothetical protein